MWRALHHVPVVNADGSMPLKTEIMRLSGAEVLPLWLAITYLSTNLILNGLNFYWFGKMMDAVTKRFKPQLEVKEKATVAVLANGDMKITADETTIRRRNAPQVEEEDIVPIP
jgi:hypothetical protein